MGLEQLRNYCPAFREILPRFPGAENSSVLRFLAQKVFESVNALPTVENKNDNDSIYREIIIKTDGGKFLEGTYSSENKTFKYFYNSWNAASKPLVCMRKEEPKSKLLSIEGFITPSIINDRTNPLKFQTGPIKYQKNLISTNSAHLNSIYQIAIRCGAQECSGLRGPAGYGDTYESHQYQAGEKLNETGQLAIGGELKETLCIKNVCTTEVSPNGKPSLLEKFLQPDLGWDWSQYGIVAVGSSISLISLYPLYQSLSKINAIYHHQKPGNLKLEIVKAAGWLATIGATAGLSYYFFNR